MTLVPETIEGVVKAGLCTGCGLCESMAGREAVEMGLGINGHMRPLVRKPLPLLVEKRIMQVCPGANLEGPYAEVEAAWEAPGPGRPSRMTEVRTTRRRPTAARAAQGDERMLAAVTSLGPADVDTTKKEPLWGPIRTVNRAWASDEDVRYHGAGGATLTALAHYLLDSGEVDAILHVKADPERPWLTISTISRAVGDLEDTAQSRYGPSSPLVLAHTLLDEGARFAVIAKPCDVSAVRSLMRRDERAAGQIRYLLTIFCGGTHHARIPKAIMRYHRVDERDVSVFTYRGDGWPGPLRVQTKTGDTHDMTYQGAWLNRPWKYDMQFRCKICVDAVGEVADISVPDGWVMKNGKPLYEEAPGTNIAITRTDAGVRLLQAATKAGYVTLAPMSIEELEPMHANHVARRVGGSAQLFALTLLRQPSYRTSGFGRRLRFTVADFRSAWDQFLGTLRRARAGDNVEPTI
ncbi:Coenzyme F420 hydrogenase/dehydrogenase, beta subunit C-terminal domain [Microbacterium lacus]|uniref:Coenzyme F420 hydrogenase n=1 Tax=Microbacterium lacus TaxID=415217 RepID=A0ABP4SZF0_9MICO